MGDGAERKGWGSTGWKQKLRGKRIFRSLKNSKTPDTHKKERGGFADTLGVGGGRTMSVHLKHGENSRERKNPSCVLVDSLILKRGEAGL